MNSQNSFKQSNIRLLSFVTCCVLFHEYAVYGSITLPPSDTETKVGNDTLLRCRVNLTGNGVEWHHTPVGSDSPTTVYADNKIFQQYSGRFSIIGNTQAGVFDLKISNVIEDDAGKYTCLVISDSKSADLTVFIKVPSDESCSARVPPGGAIGNNDCGLQHDTVRVNCTMKYRGKQLMQMEWINGEGTTLRSDSRTENDGAIVSTTNVEVSTNESISCRVRNSALNTLTRFSWKYSIKILDLQNTTVAKNTGCNSTLYCSSSITLSDCKCEWKNSSGHSFPGLSLDPKSLSTGIYVCSVKCVTRHGLCVLVQEVINHNCSKSEEQVEHVSQEGSVPVAIVVGLVLPLIAILAAAIVIVILRIKGILPIRRKKERENDGSTNAIEQLPKIDCGEQQSSGRNENPEKKGLLQKGKPVEQGTYDAATTDDQKIMPEQCNIEMEKDVENTGQEKHDAETVVKQVLEAGTDKHDAETKEIQGIETGHDAQTESHTYYTDSKT